MPEPINEQIAAAIEARLLTVTTASGYQVTIAAVLRPTQLGVDDDTPRNLLAVLEQIDPRLDEDKRHEVALTPDARPFIHWVQPWAISLYVQTSERDAAATPSDTLINRFRAAVEKALMVDPGWGATPTTPLAYATNLAAGQYFEDTAGGFVGFTVIVEVSYRTFETDPYTQPAM